MVVRLMDDAQLNIIDVDDTDITVVDNLGVDDLLQQANMALDNAATSNKTEPKEKEKKKKQPKEPKVAAPDPFWPVDAVPTHLTPEQQDAARDAGTFASLVAQEWKCSRCGSENAQSRDNPKYCSRCATEIQKQTVLAKTTNSDWMDKAKEYGLEIFERQPDETDTEWRIWETYRSYYPAKLPTWTALAEKVGCAVGTVVKAAQRWSYKVRILDWSRHCDASTQEERVEAVKRVHLEQNALAELMLQKVNDAIVSLEPEFMKPNEIVNLAKLATEMQRRSTEYVPERIDQPAIVDKTTAAQDITKVEDLNEITAILQKAGALQPGTTMGVEKTTRIVVRGGDGNE